MYLKSDIPREKLAIVIPTKDRREPISRLLESIARQRVKPIQIIIVDSGDEPVKDILSGFSGLDIDYVRLVPPSLTAQRNAGIKKLREGVTLVAFLDDDVVLEDGALKGMMKFWETAPDGTGGAGFNLTNSPYEKSGFLAKLFFVTPEKPGTVLRSGFQSINHFVDKDVDVKWLSGYSMVWRRKVFDDYMFDEWFSGYGHCEDLDFSYRVGKKYRMFIVAAARAKHLSERLDNSENSEFSLSLGKMQVLNRIYLARKNADFSLVLAYWACFGIFINNAMKGLFGRSRMYLARAKGNITGFMSSIYLKADEAAKNR